MTVLTNYSATEVYLALPTLDLEPIFNMLLSISFFRDLFYC